MKRNYFLAFVFYAASVLLSAQCTWEVLSDGVPDMTVYTIYEDHLNDRLLVGGMFYSVGNSSLQAGSIAAWNGSTWSTIGWGAGGGSYIMDFEYYNGILYAGGKIGSDFPGLITYDPLSPLAPWWTPVNGGIPGAVYTLANYDNKLYMGGIFNIVGSNHIGWWDGSQYGGAGIGVTPALYSFVNDLADYNGYLYVAGVFSFAGGIPTNNIAKWDGSNWSQVDSFGIGLNDQVTCLKVFNNELYVGGYFTTAGGISCNSIAKWNDTVWSPVGNGFNYAVLDIEIYKGELYASGYFSLSGIDTTKYIAKWNGSSWEQVGNILNGAIYNIGTYHNELYIGGNFYNPVVYFSRCNPTSGLPIDNELLINIYPSPAITTEYLFIEFQSTDIDMETVDINLFDINGKLVWKGNNQYQEKVTIQLADLNLVPGLYVLKVNVGKKRSVHKVLIY